MKIGFIGHRYVAKAEFVQFKLFKLVQQLVDDGATVFNFGSNSRFDDMAWQIVSAIQFSCKNIKLVDFYCGKENPLVRASKLDNVKCFDEVVKPQSTVGAGKRLYIERNKALIDASDIMIFYYDENYRPSYSNSGTKLAFEYAKSKNKKIINVFIDPTNIVDFPIDDFPTDF